MERAGSLAVRCTVDSEQPCTLDGPEYHFVEHLVRHRAVFHTSRTSRAKGHYGFIGWAGFYTLFVAHTVEISSVVLFFLLESAVLFRWLIWVGALGLLVGFVLYGLATRQARVLPGWCGDALIIGYPLTIVLAQYGGILFGLVWLALGYLLSSRRGTAGGRSARMS